MHCIVYFVYRQKWQLTNYITKFILMCIWLIKSNFFMFDCIFSMPHLKSMPWLWIYAMINNYEYIGARNTPCWFSWSIHLRMSCFSSIVVSWVMERVWTVRDTVPGRCCSRAGSVRSPGVITVSPHDSQNASLAAHRTTAVMSARITMTTSARLKGNKGHPHLFVNSLKAFLCIHYSLDFKHFKHTFKFLDFPFRNWFMIDLL